MKTFRLFMLVLLAVLLPIRGAVAAAMLCPEGEGKATAAVVAEHDMGDMHDMHDMQSMDDMDDMDEHDDMPAGHEMHADHAASHHHTDSDAADGESSSGHHPATCHLSASGCCMASIVGAFPPMAQPALTASVVFPTLTAPIPAFQSDGQERPPRTI